MVQGYRHGYHAGTVNRDVTPSRKESASRPVSIPPPMNTNRCTQIFATAFGLAVFSTAGCAEKATPGDGGAPAIKQDIAANPAPAAAVASTPSPPTAPKAAVVATKVSWADLKNHPFDRRDLLLAGLVGLEAQVAEQVKALDAKRASMKASTDTKGWDLAMKEMMDAQAYLAAMVIELGKSTREFWDQNKDKVGRAWVRTQDAYGKVKASTTS